MKLFFILALFISHSAFSEINTPSQDRWETSTDSQISVLALDISHQHKINHIHGLVIECSKQKNRMKISVKDLFSDPYDTIYWQTDNDHNQFINKAYGITGTSQYDDSLNQQLSQAMLSGLWITFENGSNNSRATYTLDGIQDAMKNINYCRNA